MLKYLVALLSVSLALWSGSEWISLWLFDLARASQGSSRLLSQGELALYTGRGDSKGLYLAILGQVFDVEEGRKHYGPGGGYRFFTGNSPQRTFCFLMGTSLGGVARLQNKQSRGWSFT